MKTIEWCSSSKIKGRTIELKRCSDFTTKSIHAWNDHIFLLVINACNVPIADTPLKPDAELYGAISVGRPTILFHIHVQFGQLLTLFEKTERKKEWRIKTALPEILWPGYSQSTNSMRRNLFSISPC